MIHFTKDGRSALCGAELGRGSFISVCEPVQCLNCLRLVNEMISAETLLPLGLTPGYQQAVDEALHAAKPPSLEPIIKLKTTQERCGECVYWRGIALSPDPMCRRYPTPVGTGLGSWCGEWRAKT